MQDLEFDLDLIRKYDISGPRYTSYPTVFQFSDSYAEEDYAGVAQASYATRPRALPRASDSRDVHRASEKVVQLDLGGGTPTFLSD